MYEPKLDVYNILKDIEALVLQRRPKEMKQFPAITFSVLENEVSKTLQNEISTQTFVIQIDIWATKSTECVDLLKTVEELMRNNYFTLRFSQDMEDPEGLHRITTRFSKIKGGE
jgi:hypothetical protein